MSTPSSRYRWPEFMRRVFGFDVLRCERCGGKRRVMALIETPYARRHPVERQALQADRPSRTWTAAMIPFGETALSVSSNAEGWQRVEQALALPEEDGEAEGVAGDPPSR